MGQKKRPNNESKLIVYKKKIRITSIAALICDNFYFTNIIILFYKNKQHLFLQF